MRQAAHLFLRREGVLVGKRFEGKTVIITGAGGGIGGATALILANDGANLVLVDLNQEMLDRIAQPVEATGAKFITVIADVTNDADVVNYIAKAQEAFGDIHGFFNNAGIEGSVKPFVETTMADFDKVVGVNQRGAFIGLLEVGKVMAKQGHGSIVNTASIAAIRGLPTTVGYNASKHAVLGMTRTAATELSPRGVRVNAVLPGFIDTRMLHDIFHEITGDRTDNNTDMLLPNVPMHRLGRADEIGEVVAFLLSDAASYVTGEGIVADGGATISVGAAPE